MKREQGSTRTALPLGASAVAPGLAILGASSFVFLGVSGRALGPEAFAPLAAVWVLINLIGPGLFVPLEQEVARSLSSRRASGDGAGGLISRAAGVGGVFLLATLTVLLALSSLLVPRIFGGDWALFAAFLASLATTAAAYLARGILAGTGGFGRYGVQLGLDGVVRVLGSLFVVAFGTPSAAAFAWVLALAPLLSTLAVLPRRLARQPGPPAALSEITKALGWLLVASLASQTLINAAPVVASALVGPEGAAEASQVMAGIVLARIPLFLFAAVQAGLIPALTRQATLGDLAGFRRALGRITGVVGVLAVAGMAGVAFLGTWLTRLVYGPGFELSAEALTLFALSTGLLMLGAVLSQSLVSLGSYRSAALGWVLGCLAFAAMLPTPLGLAERMGTSLIVGAGVTLAALWVLLRRSLRLPARLGAVDGPAPSPDQWSA